MGRKGHIARNRSAARSLHYIRGRGTSRNGNLREFFCLFVYHHRRKRVNLRHHTACIGSLCLIIHTTPSPLNSPYYNRSHGILDTRSSSASRSHTGNNQKRNVTAGYNIVKLDLYIEYSSITISSRRLRTPFCVLLVFP